MAKPIDSVSYYFIYYMCYLLQFEPPLAVYSCVSHMEKQALTRCFTVLLVLDDHVTLVENV